MVERSRRQESAFRSDLPCPMCGRSLVLVTFHAATFQCVNGHELGISDLMAVRSAALRVGVERMVRDWERHRDSLGATAEDAARKGYLEIAQIFRRQQDVLQERIETIRSALVKSVPPAQGRSAS